MKGKFLAGAVAGGVASALIFGGLVVMAGVGGPELDIVTACVINKTGLLRIIDPTIGQSCLKTETQLTWNQQGSPGPAGPPGEPGLALVCTSAGAVPKWDVATTSWMCGTDTDTDTLTLLAEECTVNQTVNFDGEGWECRSAPIVATLSDTVWASPVPGSSVSQMFDARSANIDGTQPCTAFFYCRIKLVDVVDHTTCQLTITGNPGSNNVLITSSTTYIQLDGMGVLTPGQPVYINVSCVR